MVVPYRGGRSRGPFPCRSPNSRLLVAYFVFRLFVCFRINKPGGCGKITKIHYGAVDGTTVESLDVKYVVGSGSEKELDPGVVFPYETLERTGRQRRGRDFLGGRMEDTKASRKNNKAAHDDENEPQQANAQKGVKKNTTTNKRKPTTAKPNTDKRVKQEASGGHKPLEASAETTSPSTPDQKKKPKAKKVTPIPAYVLAHTTDCDVSPLFATGWNETTTKTTDVARRGLFDGTEDHHKLLISKPAAMQKKTKKKKALPTVTPGLEIKQTPERKLPAKEITNKSATTAPTSSKTAKKSSSGATNSKAARAIMTSTKSRPVVLASSSDLQKAKKTKHSRPASLELAKTAKKAPPLKTTESLLQVPKYASMQTKKMDLLKTAPTTKPILAFPRPKTMALPTKTGGRKALKDVYDDERRKAKQFLDDVCGARDDDIVVDPSKENSVNQLRVHQQESKESL